MLELVVTSDVPIQFVTVFTASSPEGPYEETSLNLEGDVWSGILFLQDGDQEPVKLHYYLQFDLEAKTPIFSGSKAAPLSLGIRPSSEKPLDRRTYSDFEPLSSSQSTLLGLPTWAIWAIGGTVGAGVITGIVAGIASASSGEATGSIELVLDYGGN